MKTKLNLTQLTRNILIALSLIIVSSCGQPPKKNESASFKLVVERTNGGIKMKSVKGTAWTDLSFSLNIEQTQVIDEWGMTTLNGISTKKDSNFANLLFTIKMTDNNIVLKGIEGTAWTDLSFTLPKNEKQAIDEFGMTEL